MADRSVVVRLRAQVGEFQAGMRAAGKSVDDVQRRMADGDAKTQKNLQQVSRGMMLVGVAGVAAAGVAVAAFARFDKQMSAVQAATHESAEGMDDLREAALQAGADTVFSATEAAAAIENLAKAGISTADILGGALTGALDLAAAGELDVAQAAEIMATALTQFGKPGTEAAHVADLLAAGAGKAQGEVTDMALALKYAGVPANALGVSIEETAGTIALFAKNGIIGEQAGTSLRSMLGSLTAPSEKASALMTKLGISVFDAQGNFVGFNGVADILNDKLGTLTQQERSAALGIIFGNEAMQAANVLTAKGADAVDNWTNKVNDQGYAAETAATKLDNLAGDVEAFTGSLETALIESGSGANVALRGITQQATGAVNAFSRMPDAVQTGTVAVAGLGGAALTALGGIGYLVPKVQDARDALFDLGRGGQFADKWLGRIGRGAGYGAAFVAIAIAANKADDAIRGLAGDVTPDVDRMTRSLVKLGQDGKTTGELVRVFGDDLGGLDDDMERLTSGGLEGFRRGWGELGDSLGITHSEFEDAREDLRNVDAGLAELVKSGHADVAASAMKRLGVTIADLKEAGGGTSDYADALAEARTQASLAAGSTAEFGASVEETIDPIEKAADALDHYKDSLDAVNGVNITAARARLDFADAMKESNKATEKGAKVTDDERRSLYDLAEQGNAWASAVADMTGSQHEANEVLEKSRRGFVRTAIAMGFTREEAILLREKFLAFPEAAETDVRTPGLRAAIANSTGLKQLLDGIDGNYTATVNILTRGQIPAGVSVRQLEGERAAGGPVRPYGMYLVGEQGPELFQSSTPGHIVPAGPTAAILSGQTPLAAGAYGGSGGGGMTSAGRAAFMRDLIVNTHQERVEDVIPRTLENAMYRIGA